MHFGSRLNLAGMLSRLEYLGIMSSLHQAITSAGFHIAQVIQLFSSWGSRRILPTNSYSCLSLLLVSCKKCRMNLIGPWHLGAFLRDQSDSSYIAYVRQVARTNKNMSLLTEFSWIFRMKTAESGRQYETQHLLWPALIIFDKKFWFWFQARTSFCLKWAFDFY